ncbi:glycoside hydrolase family 78 protein [Aaosphaeria arxii CBS 175.79]|uniref:alpha-L-rhamnosidase n=1 Tax=Aaosphaeria arxii CBS 175.79 TaxID=1450172 RepID=A0A6A5XBV8_9PLEO|nr:glycoside hydrolase family 78 protein [Aaosphaeria arxii CBS 175.79]KAF2010389.1 glycoside hydrolase family 78 protein [Aaosphaeria arxii CBS 175.79]
MAFVQNVRFEHYSSENTLGIHETRPRISWAYQSETPFRQHSYNIELSECSSIGNPRVICSTNVSSTNTILEPWPLEQPLQSRQRVSVRIQGISEQGQLTPWSEPATLETGLMDPSDWKAQRIASPWPKDVEAPQPEELFRVVSSISETIASARLYITAQGLYEAEINGKRVGDYFLAPGWTEYNSVLHYQTYDVTELLVKGDNCLGVRVSEGWFNGRIGFEGGRRNIWGSRNCLIAQLEVTTTEGIKHTIVSDSSWSVTTGPIRRSEIYDGELYDASKEVHGWSTIKSEPAGDSVCEPWHRVDTLDPLPGSITLTAGYKEPTRRVQTIEPIAEITTPSGKTVLDFGQNLVGYLRIKSINGPAGHKVTFKHAEVLENGELGTRPLRECRATDEYVLKGSNSDSPETWEPRFTFHGFRYAQIDQWPEGCHLKGSIEAVVCHTDMLKLGDFQCSNDMLNKLWHNVTWSMRDNFLSVPTDCPQRDERLGWTGDLALFAPTAMFMYQCTGILRDWLIDFQIAQQTRDGLPAMVVPDVLVGHPNWDLGIPCAIWHDVAVIGPWAVYSATGDVEILRTQYGSMQQWMDKIERHTDSQTPNLWHPKCFQLGDWLDPSAPPDAPFKSATDSKLVADAFLIQSLRLMSLIAGLIGNAEDEKKYSIDFTSARKQFQDEWVTPNGLMSSDSQTAYALAICFDLLTESQRSGAGNRLARIVGINGFNIGTGFAGTPYICEALAQTGHTQVAYAMLLNQTCPSWLYPITMGATTTWERWDSMLPDGSINPGDMTSFNHYAFGAVATFLHERVAGLSQLEPGWKRVRIEPKIGADITSASASHITPYGLVSVSWNITDGGKFNIEIIIPEGVIAELVTPDGSGVKLLEGGRYSFDTSIEGTRDWPLKPISLLPF